MDKLTDEDLKSLFYPVLQHPPDISKLTPIINRLIEAAVLGERHKWMDMLRALLRAGEEA